MAYHGRGERMRVWRAFAHNADKGQVAPYRGAQQHLCPGQGQRAQCLLDMTARVGCGGVLCSTAIQPRVLGACAR